MVVKYKEGFRRWERMELEIRKLIGLGKWSR